MLRAKSTVGCSFAARCRGWSTLPHPWQHFAPGDPRADGEQQQLRAGDRLVVLQKKTFIEFRRLRTFSA